MADFARATGKMTMFLAGRIGALEPSSVSALGYSNGANILASVLFAAPELIGKAVADASADPVRAGGAARTRRPQRAHHRRAARSDLAGGLTERLASYFVAEGRRCPHRLA